MLSVEMGCFLILQCRALSKRLALAEKSKEALAEEMKLASQNISRLQVSAYVLPMQVLYLFIGSSWEAKSTFPFGSSGI
jgi:hypothetical protein